MYLMFWVPHPGQPVPIFEDITHAFATGPLGLQGAIAVAGIGIAAMAFLNLKLLFWNIAQYRAFARTEAFQTLIRSNGDTQRLAMPLAIAMSINVGFILGLVFVPGLWGVVEYLFPLALVAFGLTGALALSMIGQFLRRILTEPGSFDMAANNSFVQFLPGFALAMVAVGFSAAAAMSATPAIVGLGLIGSTFFASAAVLLILVAAVLAVHAMLMHGAAEEAAPSLLIVIPILTVLGIMMVRQDHGMHVTLGGHVTPVETLMMLSRILSVQGVFALFGLMVLRAHGYGAKYLYGDTPSAGAYALVCPGVALSVMLQFWLNKGLVATGLIDKFSLAYWAISALAIGLQVAMIVLVIHLNRQHFGHHPDTALPAA